MTIMAPLLLPKFIVIKSVYSEQCAYRMNQSEEVHGFVSCGEENVFSTLVKIEVERAKSNDNYVHLRFCDNNRYWARAENDVWIVARSKQPVEDTSNRSCTLFEPSKGKDGHHYLRHVQSRGRVRTNFKSEEWEKSNRIFVDDQDGGDQTPWYAFMFIDQETIVQLPEQVAFKGDNDLYLSSTWIESHPYLQFSSKDSNDLTTAHQVTMTADGHIHIRSKYMSGLYWRNGTNWIWADSTDGSGDTLFWPVKLDKNTIALRSKGNRQLCKRLTTEGKESCLNAAAITITKEARLQVAEPILKREVFDVKYRMEDARIFDEEPIVVGKGHAYNNSNKTSKITVKVAYNDEKSTSLADSISITTGIQTEVKAGFPFIVDGKIQLSTEVTGTVEWNITTTTKLGLEAAYEATVPPNSKVTVEYVATKGTCNVPFSYTRRDKFSSTGQFVLSPHTDGEFTGINCYSFFFNEHKIEPL